MCPWFDGFGGNWLGGGIFMMLMMMLFWGLLLVGGFVLVRKLLVTGQDAGQAPSSSTALEILKERYAKGEISKEEFETMKQDII